MAQLLTQPAGTRLCSSASLDFCAVQDPYHNTGQAIGLSFSVPPGKAVPSSLQNIYKELKDDCACTAPKHGDLEKASTLLTLALHSNIVAFSQ